MIKGVGFGNDNKSEKDCKNQNTFRQSGYVSIYLTFITCKLCRTFSAGNSHIKNLKCAVTIKAVKHY